MRSLAITLLLLPSGCGAGHQQGTTLVDEDLPPNVEIATGDLREALIHLSRVHFAMDSAELTPRARAELRRVADVLREHPEVSLFIEGHADPRGAQEYNLGLGQQRAEAVAHYTTGLGIEADRLNVVSYGEERPIAPEPDRTGLARNRRVEFRLVRGEVRLILDEGDLVDDRGNAI